MYNLLLDVHLWLYVFPYFFSTLKYNQWCIYKYISLVI
jgi:hypothetical protein